QLALANQFNDRGIELIRRSDAKEIAGQALLQEAMRSATFGSCGPVSAITKRALELSREQAHLVNAANALAACGQSRAAETLADDLSKGFPLDTLLNTVSIPIIRAQNELGHGNTALVIQLLEPTRKYEVFGDFWPQYLRGQAYLKQKNGAQ